MLAVAVSGGVDSLFALYERVKTLGPDRVLAIYGRFLPADPARDPVPGLEANCRTLGVPLHVVDAEAAFREAVMAPFAAAYAAGETPNPCALCNPRIKFGLLLEQALALGATHLATGHYARLTEHPVYGLCLAAAADGSKDQSYFLALVPGTALARLRFPLAHRHKADIRTALAEAGLQVPLPVESQEICFVPDNDYRGFLDSWEREAETGPHPHGAARPSPCPHGGALSDSCRHGGALPDSCRHGGALPDSCRHGGALSGPGPITLIGTDTVLGTHQGLWRYTEGQRRGLGIAWQEPLYVVGKNVAANTLLVGPHPALLTRICTTAGANVLVPPALWPDRVFARVRYRQIQAAASVRVESDGLHITFDQPQTRAAPGQLAVIYDSDGHVLAGGLIAVS